MENKVAVLLLIFNRPDTALKALEPIKTYKPDRLYIAADGPRKEKEGEVEICNETRNAVLSGIDWDCKLHTLFRDENLGCGPAVSSAISWFFEHEKYGVIVEDDVILSQDFFYLCETLLPLYEEEERIMQISAQNRSGKCQISNEYSFNIEPMIWGWATWRRVWDKMDLMMTTWPKFNKLKLFSSYGLFQGLMMWRYYKHVYEQLPSKHTWAVIWSYIVLYNKGLCICPKVNLAVNCGIGNYDATHYEIGDVDPYAGLKFGTLEKPLRIASEIIPDKKQMKYDRKDFFRVRMIGLRKKILKKFKRNGR